MGHVTDDKVGANLEARVAAELRAELARQGRSRRWLAERIDAPLTSVARWVKGTTAPGLDELDAMARALGTTVPRLLADAQRGGYRARPLKDPEERASVTLAGGGLLVPVQRSA